MSNGDQQPVTYSFLHSKFEQVREIMDNTLKQMNKTADNDRKANISSHDHIRNDVRELRANDQKHEEASTSLQLSVTEMKTDVAWLKRFFWIVATSSIGALVTGLLNFIALSNKT